jgi:hypothetical protein
MGIPPLTRTLAFREIPTPKCDDSSQATMDQKCRVAHVYKFYYGKNLLSIIASETFSNYTHQFLGNGLVLESVEVRWQVTDVLAAMFAVFYFVDLYFTIVKDFDSGKAGVSLIYYTPGEFMTAMRDMSCLRLIAGTGLGGK